jgi:hypothetical protein
MDPKDTPAAPTSVSKDIPAASVSVSEEKAGSCPYKAYAHVLQAVIIVLVVLLLLHWMYLGEYLSVGGGYVGAGLNDQVYTSGADLRRLGQQFSSTDQGSSDYVSNKEILGREGLTIGRKAKQANNARGVQGGPGGMAGVSVAGLFQSTPTNGKERLTQGRAAQLARQASMPPSGIDASMLASYGSSKERPWSNPF